jgi:Tfp pilus assembly protein PilO
MKELFDLLEAKERQFLAALCILLAAVLIFYSGFALKAKRVYFRSVESLPSQQEEYERIKDKNSEKKRERMMWNEARQDVAHIEEKYFYREDGNINELREDLREILRNAQIQVTSDLRFEYSEFEGREMNTVKVSFRMTGFYFALKKLLYSIEQYPKFIMVERIDFLDIDTQSGMIELRIELMGYYES